MPAALTTTRCVEFADTDMAGIIHFTTFFRMMESAEHEFLRSLGTSVVDKHPEDGSGAIGWPRREAQCEFHSPAVFEDELELGSTVERMGRSSLTLGYEFRRGQTLIANGRMKTVCCRVAPGAGLTAIEIPEPLRGRLGELVDRE